MCGAAPDPDRHRILLGKKGAEHRPAGIRAESKHGMKLTIRSKRRTDSRTLKNRDEIYLPRASEELVGLIRAKTENLFETRQLFCSEAVLFVLNQGLGGGLPPETAINLASCFGEGMGGAGCLCGAASGALMAIGLFLGPGQSSKKVRDKGREFHDIFRSEFGAVCCRILKKKARDDRKGLFRQCMTQTGAAAELAARMILMERPELAEHADRDFLEIRDSKLMAALKRPFR